MTTSSEPRAQASGSSSSPASPALALRARILRSACVLVGLVLLTGLIGRAEGQAPDGDPRNPLASKQDIVRDRVGRLEDRMFQLAEMLGKSEPEHAEKLIAALQKSRELALRGDMGAVVKLLEARQFSEATEKQKSVSENLDTLLRLLLDEFGNRDEVAEEIKRLEAALKNLQQIIKEEKKERADSRAAANPSAAQAALNRAIAQMKMLIRRQAQQVAASEAAASGRRPAGGQALAKEQQGVRRDAEPLGEQVEKLPAPEAKAHIEKAAEQMQRAENKLDASKVPAATKDQKAALEQLEEALKELERKQEQLAKKPAFAKMASEQRGTESKTGALAKQMSGGQDKSGQGQGKPGQGKPSPMPGQQQIQKAQQHMQQAAGGLDKKNPAQAGEEQDRALEQLEQAREQLEERLRQLREEEKAELLADLEARFRSMLAKQIAINKGTTALDQKGKPTWRRADRLLVAKLATDERGVADEAGAALKMLKDDGTSVVFPRVVEQLQEDMLTVATHLAASNVGRLTQEIETEIVRMLKDLIDALEQMQRSGGGGGGGSGQAGKAPLLPPSAELKLLRAMQIRVNDLTTAFNEIRGDGDALDPALLGEVRKVAGRQDGVAGLARDIIERVNGE